MTLQDLYLICFIVGLLISLLSFFGGFLHVHLPGHVDHIMHAHTHLPHLDHGAAASNDLSPFNLPTIMAFLAWFGGTGYLLTHHFYFGLLSGLCVALLVGSAGAAIMFLFLARVLAAHDHSMNPAEYDMLGLLAKVTSSIHEGGTGEIVYSQGGTRKTAGARSVDGSAISRGENVVITRYEKGIAYVCRLKEAT